MAKASIEQICFFGGFETGYPRHDVLRKGLEKLGVRVRMCRTSPRRRVLTRYAILTFRYLTMQRGFKVIFVPEFRHKDVPLAYALAKLTGKRVVFDPLVSRFDTKVRDRGDAREGSFQSWHNRNLDRLSLSLCDVVISDTRAHADYYAEEFAAPPEKIRVLPVGFDEDLFVANGCGEDTAAERRPFRVLFFGNFLPLHGVDVIVSAARLLRDLEDIEFVLIGRGQTFPEVEAYVAKHRLKNVRLQDRVPIRSLARSLSEADVSLGVFGRTDKTRRVVANKVYQSMAVGKAVITADSPAVRELFSDGVNICLVPPADAKALADKIRLLRTQRELLRTIGAEASRLVHERFSSRAIAGLFLEYCGELLDPERPSARADGGA